MSTGSHTADVILQESVVSPAPGGRTTTTTAVTKDGQPSTTMARSGSAGSEESESEVSAYAVRLTPAGLTPVASAGCCGACQSTLSSPSQDEEVGRNGTNPQEE